jgi:radical SAM superfamily enzyme YgiQ (UPF0313 family)
MLDIVFCNLPYSNLEHINSAPAILKGVVTQEGYSAKTIDFGCELLKLCDNDPGRFYQIQEYFIVGEYNKTENLDTINKFYDLVINWFKTNPSRYIGITVFSIYTHKASMEILTRIKENKIPSKIIVGGRGITVPFLPVLQPTFKLSALDSQLTTGELFKRKKLVSDAVIGDGEDAIVSILNNNSDYHNFTLERQVSEQFKSPVPDYSDYNFNNYLFGDSLINWPITGSKGCVRDCDFCDIKRQFGKYRYRSGKDIVNDMIEISKIHGARKFQFTDSLVNGGLKPFREFLETLSDYNISNPKNKIKWNFFILTEKE